MRLDLNPLLFYTSEFRYVEWNFNNLLGIEYWCHLKCLLEILLGFIPIHFVSSSIFNEVYINWIWIFVLLEIFKWKDSNLKFIQLFRKLSECKTSSVLISSCIINLTIQQNRSQIIMDILRNAMKTFLYSKKKVLNFLEIPMMLRCEFIWLKLQQFLRIQNNIPSIIPLMVKLTQNSK